MEREVFESRLDAWRVLYGKAKEQLDHALVDVEIYKTSIGRVERVAHRAKVERNIVLALWLVTVGLLLVLV